MQSMIKDWYPPTNDVIFKKLFIEHTDLLKSFLSRLLKIDINSITELTVLNSETTPQYIDGKITRFDIRLSTREQFINIEMQNLKQRDFVERVLFYWSKMYTGDLKESELYTKLKKSISINVLNYKMFSDNNDNNNLKDNKYLSSFSIYEDYSKVLLTDKLKLYFIELPKVDNKHESNNIMKLWLQFIKAKNQEELNMLKDTEIPEITKAINTLHHLNNDQKIRAEAWEREKAERDYASDMYYARAEGKEEGRAEGKEEVAITLLTQGLLSLENIAIATGLTIEKLQELKKSIS